MSEVFGRYEVVDAIATGGMAEVLLARTLDGTRRVCALKRILPQYSNDLHFVSMFIDEARITIGLSHENVVQLFDFGQANGTYFMAMEYVDGTDLANLLRTTFMRGGALPPIVTAYLLARVAAGLGHAHGLCDARQQPLGIVHRDVSPQNVLLSSDGQVKITDFGIAAARHKLTLTTPGMVLGKAAYMSPEQAQGLGVDARTDLWALGVLMWECLVGQRLFAEENPVLTLQRVLSDEIAPPSRHQPAVPAALDRICLSLLERRRERRPQVAALVAAQLDAVVADLAQTSPLARGGVFDRAAFAAWLGRIEWAENTSPLRPPPSQQAAPTAPPVSPVDATAKRRRFEDDGLRALCRRVARERDPWLLVDVGHGARAHGDTDAALAAFRVAASAFAARGLLVQALCALGDVRALIGGRADDDVLRVVDIDPLVVDDHARALAEFVRADPSGWAAEFARALPPVADDDRGPSPPATVPLLSALGPKELVSLSRVIVVRRVRPGDVVIREGDRGDTLFAIGRGRFVVSCKPGDDAQSVSPTTMNGATQWGAEATANESGVSVARLVLTQQRVDRVFLAALADGDFFGEFSFLAERPRSATVEAATDGCVVEIDRSDVDGIAHNDPAFTEPLHAFFKERVVELMMAKSPVFSLVPIDDRKRLLERAIVVDFRDEDVIVHEGMQNDAVFFIKRGEVEVFRTDPHGLSIFINKLGAGQFFGEMAALKRTPRTVSVRAIGPVSLFQLDGGALADIVDKEPDLKRALSLTMRERAKEIQARVKEHQSVFFT